MDSMRSLNTSLPRTSPRRRATASGQQPPEALLAAFKAAALSVTSLYRTAASEQKESRAAGYQDALDDLLVFLDRENLGLGDGEGWRVRRWATERLDGTSYARGESDEEEEAADEDKARSSSPEMARKALQAEDHTTEPIPQESQAEPTPMPPPAVEEPQQQPQMQEQPTFTMPQSNLFSFRSAQPYPTNHDREVNMDNASVTSDTTSHSNANDSERPSVRVEVYPRNPRSRHNHSRTNNSRQNATILGSGAGSKRKTPFGDFFDIDGLSFNDKDGSGRGGKKGRHV